MSNVEFEANDNNSGDEAVNSENLFNEETRVIQDKADLIDIGNRIRESRKANLNMTVPELAARSGVSQASLYRYEKGENAIPVSELRKVCDALRTSPVRILYGTDNFDSRLDTGASYFDVSNSMARVVKTAILMTALGDDDQVAVARLVYSLSESRVEEKQFQTLRDFSEMLIPFVTDMFEGNVEFEADTEKLGREIAKKMNLPVDEKIDLP